MYSISSQSIQTILHFLRNHNILSLSLAAKTKQKHSKKVSGHQLEKSHVTSAAAAAAAAAADDNDSIQGQ